MFLEHMKWAMLWAFLIFILCALPGKDIPYSDLWNIFNLDKLIYASLFFVQALLLVQGFKQQTLIFLFTKSPKFYAASICLFYGADLELMQGAFFEDRTADFYDFVANSFGTFMAILFYQKLLNYRQKFIFK